MNNPFAIQIVLDENFEKNQSNFFAFLSDVGFRGVELNIANHQKVNVRQLTDFLSFHHLQMTMFASGLSAKINQLSLSSANEDIRKKSVDECIEYIEFASKFDAGVILGFIKGGVVSDKSQAKDYFIDSLQKLVHHAEKYKTTVLVEATNRYETSVATNVKEAVEIVASTQSSFFKILADTFHMNIEEKNMLQTLKDYKDFYVSLHLSDNNRLLPGLGAINFEAILDFLEQQQYTGWFALEGNVETDLKTDIQLSMNYLNKIRYKSHA